MVRLNNYYALKSNESINLEDFALFRVRIKYAQDEVINHKQDAILVCKALLDIFDDLLACPNFNNITLIFKKVRTSDITNAINNIGLEIENKVDMVEKFHFEAAFSHTIEARLYPKWMSVKYKRDNLFFKDNEFFDRSKLKDCVRLMRTELVDNHLCIHLAERYAKTIKLMKLTELNLSDETIGKFKESSKGYIELFNSRLHSLPAFDSVRVVRISKNIEFLSNGEQSRESICEYWQQAYNIKLPIDEQSSKVYFCLTESGDIFPSCCLLHEGMALDRNRNDLGRMALKYLTDFRKCVEKMLIFPTTKTVNFTNANTNDLKLCNPKNFIGFSELALSKLNSNKLLVNDSDEATSVSSRTKKRENKKTSKKEELPTLNKKLKALSEKNQNIEFSKPTKRRNSDELVDLDLDENNENMQPPLLKKKLLMTKKVNVMNEETQRRKSILEDVESVKKNQSAIIYRNFLINN